MINPVIKIIKQIQPYFTLLIKSISYLFKNLVNFEPSSITIHLLSFKT